MTRRPGGTCRRHTAGTPPECRSPYRSPAVRQSPYRRHATVTVPPGGVNFSAFDIRFQTTCCRRFASPTMRHRCRARNVDANLLSQRGRRHRFDRAVHRRRPDRMASAPAGGCLACRAPRRGCRRRSSPALARCVRSPRSPAASFRDRAGRWRAFATSPGPPTSGVRSSCDSVARNSSFNRLSSSAFRNRRAFSTAHRHAARELLHQRHVGVGGSRAASRLPWCRRTSRRRRGRARTAAHRRRRTGCNLIARDRRALGRQLLGSDASGDLHQMRRGRSRPFSRSS